MQWGIPVPGDSDHTIYVWLDALTNYLTGASPEIACIGGVFYVCHNAPVLCRILHHTDQHMRSGGLPWR